MSLLLTRRPDLSKEEEQNVMRKSTKKGLWRGIASLTCFTLSLSLILGNVLEANAGTIDTYLGTASEVFVSDNTEENPLYDKFTPLPRSSTPTAPATPTPSSRLPSIWAAVRWLRAASC